MQTKTKKNAEKQTQLWKRIQETFFRSLKKSIKTLLFILKIVMPVSIIVIIINNTPLINYIADFMQPVMSVFWVSGKVALPLLLGIFSGITESIGALIALQLPAREITIIAVMVGLCNSLIAETLIFKKISKHYWKTGVIRFSVACITGYFLKLVV